MQVLYKLAYTSSCKRDMAAEDWHKKYEVFVLLLIFMVALCNRADHYIFVLFLSFFFLFFFSLPNLSGRRLDVYHILAHGVVLVRI